MLGLLGLAAASAASGDEESACASLERARAAALGHRSGQTRNRFFAEVTASLGRLSRQRGDRRRALALHREAMEIHHDVGHVPGIVQAIEDLAGLRVDAGATAQAVRLLGAAQATRDARGHARPPALGSRYAADVAAARASLGPERFQEAWSHGMTLSLEEAAAYALRGWGRRPRNRAGWDALTRTERSVIALVREGLTNRQIAERLSVAPRTIDAHIANIFVKLGVRSRARLAAEAAGRHL